MKSYFDQKFNKCLKVGEFVEYTEKDFKYAESSLEEWGGGFLKKVEQRKKRTKKVVDEE